MIKIVDYGLGNISAFLNVYKRLNIPAVAAKTASELEGADKIVLPGVGHFDHAMKLLNGSGMRETLDRMVTTDKIPVVGICVGMQILARSSEEGTQAGLGWIDADVRWFKTAGNYATALPHMGWNDVQPAAGNKLFAGLEQDARFYFLHSYYMKCDRKEDELAICNYGSDFCCAVNVGTIYGVQFHPEKSHRFGVSLLKNFAEL